MNNREAFEAWAEKELYALDKREGSDIYRNVITRNAWLGWNAALAAQQQDHIPDVGQMVQSQAQQTKSQWINLSKDDYSHLKGDELIYAYGLGCGIFEAYLKGYVVVRDEVFFHNTSEVSHIIVRKPVVLPLPPAPEGDNQCN